MFLKLMRTVVTKNENFSEILLKRMYYSVTADRLRFGNYYSLQHRTKFNVQNWRDVNQYYPFRNSSVSNNP